MEFKQLESFIAVVKYRSFTKAAEILYISQPTISAHVRMLEEELQSRLIVRTTKSIEITPRGQELYECASNILRLRDNLLKSWTMESRKLIHLGVSTIPSAYILPEILPRFKERFPDIQFAVEQSDSQGIVDAMQHGKFDVGMIGMPCEDKELVCIPFCRDKMVMITPVSEPFLTLKQEGEISAVTLLDNPVILRERGSGSQKSADYFLESMGVKEGSLNIVARMNDQEAIKNLVAGGLGISFISERAAQNFVDEGRLLRFDLPKRVSGRYLYVVYHKDNIYKTYINEFVRYVQKYYGQTFESAIGRGAVLSSEKPQSE